MKEQKTATERFEQQNPRKTKKAIYAPTKHIPSDGLKSELGRSRHPRGIWLVEFSKAFHAGVDPDGHRFKDHLVFRW